MANPLVVKLKDGQEVGVDTLAKVRKHYPDGKIVRYQDGSEYDGEQPGDSQSDSDSDSSKSKDKGK